ncbi:hypothetical protein APSETT444_001568 [Aspergillus pseudonomiae]
MLGLARTKFREYIELITLQPVDPAIYYNKEIGNGLTVLETWFLRQSNRDVLKEWNADRSSVLRDMGRKYHPIRLSTETCTAARVLDAVRDLDWAVDHTMEH